MRTSSLVLSFALLLFGSMPGCAQTAFKEPTGAQPQAPSQDTIIICLAPKADQVRVGKLLAGVHGTVTQRIHVQQDNFDMLFVRPQQGKGEATVATILKCKDKNIRTIELTTCYTAEAPFHPVAHTQLPDGTRLTLGSSKKGL